MTTLDTLCLDVYKVTSQTSDNDRLSLLVLQACIRESLGTYAYLEIGSYLGGTLLPFVQDQHCQCIYSIDKRGMLQHDERGVVYSYIANSSRRMLDGLSRHCSREDLDKVRCIDGISRELDTAQFEPIDFCLIDGEHTDQSAWEDFQLCLHVSRPDSVIVFHDADIVYKGIGRVIQYLEDQTYSFNAYHLPDVLFVIELGESNYFRHALVQEHILKNGFRGYLSSLEHTEPFRRFYNTLPFKILRNVWYFLCRKNVVP